jgi:hypothetical protein
LMILGLIFWSLTYWEFINPTIWNW